MDTNSALSPLSRLGTSHDSFIAPWASTRSSWGHLHRRGDRTFPCHLIFRPSADPPASPACIASAASPASAALASAGHLPCHHWPAPTSPPASPACTASAASAASVASPASAASVGHLPCHHF